MRIEAEWERFANIVGNADQFIGEMVDLIESKYREKVDKNHPDAIYRLSPSNGALLDLQSAIAQSSDVFSWMSLVKDGEIEILTNLLKKFVENLTPEAARSVSDKTMKKLDDHLLGLCAFGEPPVLPTNLFLGWGSLVIFGNKRSAFLNQVDVQTLIKINNTRLSMQRPTGWVDTDFS